MGPTRSLSPTPNSPFRLTNPCDGESPTMLLNLAGMRIDGPPSSPIAHVTKLAATDAAEPPLEPPGLRSVSYGLHSVPPKELRSPPAYSPIFDLARMIAPASRRRFTTVASRGGRSFA